MILSMTGYGSARRQVEGVSYSLELRSLNNRYFKASIRLPEWLQFLEVEVDRLLRTRFQRGSVTFTLRTKDESDSAAVINLGALQGYLDGLGRARVPGGVASTIDVATLLLLPGVCPVPELDEDERGQSWELVRGLMDEAMDELLEMRRREGEALHADFRVQCDAIRQQLGVVERLAPTVAQEYHKKLRDRVNVLLASAQLTVDEDALLREVSLYADRCDITEEIVRLRSHLDQFIELCDGREPAGRKLDFVAQELLREANTVGSKSNNAAITRCVVEIKSAIDRLKEQVQNAE